MNRKNYLIALDIGTTSTKGILYDISGAIADTQSLSYRVHYPEEAMVEQDADEVLEAVVGVVRALTQRNTVNSVEAVVFGGILNSMMPVDRHGKPLNRALIWADSRSAKYSEELRSILDKEEVKRRTGCSIHPMYFLPRLRWFQKEDPGVYKETAKFISIKEYILYRVFGGYMVDRSTASGTGIWNMEKLDWDAELLGAVDIRPEAFSQVVRTTHIQVGLKKEFASRMGIPSGTPGIIGASDGPLAHLGSVGISEDSMSMTVGTGAALRRIVSSPTVIEGTEAWCYYMTEGLWLLGGVIQDAGLVMKWFSDTFLQYMDESRRFELMNRYAEEIPPGSNGLVFIPTLSGERAPHENPHIRGALFGLSFNHTLKHMVRALMEGISYRLHSVYRMLAYDRDLEIVMTGGILKSPIWMQLVSDFFGKRLWRSSVQEASAWGGVLLGLRALGIVTALDRIPEYIRNEVACSPNSEKHDVYRRLYGAFDEAYSRIVRPL